tara:strand:- start:25098 stop:25784 length:687 start_codon:yes stop_codon:yes gene_type:complete
MTDWTSLINIIYQDEYLVVVDKPSGLLVHPFKEATNERDNLMALLRDKVGKWVYPVHRIDRPVSGIVIFGFSGEVVSKIKEFWGDNTKTKKEYIALARGQILEAGRYDFELSNDKKVRQEAITNFRPLHQFDDTTLVHVTIETGRKHQIRRHFSRRMQCLVGDTAYGKGILNERYRQDYNLHRIFLHAWRLTLPHPITGEVISWTCPIRSELQDVLTAKGLPEFPPIA